MAPRSPSDAVESDDQAGTRAMGQVTFFERERGRLMAEVGESMESLLGNINLLNRNLESVIAVGKEFEAVSALWTKFSDVIQEGGVATGEV